MAPTVATPARERTAGSPAAACRAPVDLMQGASAQAGGGLYADRVTSTTPVDPRSATRRSPDEATRVSGMSQPSQGATKAGDRIVWVDCEMTGLDLGSDALVEIACVVTDAELRELDAGVTVVIRPPDAPFAAMPDVVREMHTASGLIEEIPSGTTLEDAQRIVLDYIKGHVAEPRKAPLAGSSVYVDRGFLARDMPELDAWLHYRLIDVSSIKVPAGLLQLPAQDRQPPGPGRHPREHRRAAVLPRGRPRARPRPLHRRRPRDRRQARRRPRLTHAPRPSPPPRGRRRVITPPSSVRVITHERAWTVDG